ncbi:hypothetical protein [Mesonia maritima]|uniref:Polysaccharide chain length determinant N-terminal domain-containing protein n=1 Tax=Mesonia maritima TaxID=1793873 RepID=A0ABU1K3C6_9FLAO|nr:hypothetical protein [Mesonia maritima]MDR6299811.1 hypothetical protein [Mesonia maritima]
MSTRNNGANHSEEVDLYSLINLIKRAFEKIGLIFLRFLNFLIRNIIVIALLIIIGLALAYFTKGEKGRLYQTEIIVATNFDGSVYLKKSLDEARFKLFSRNEEFLNKTALSEDIDKIASLKVEPIYRMNEYTNEQYNFMRYFEETKFLDDEEKAEAFKNNTTRYKVTLVHYLPLDSSNVLEKIIGYVRDNSFYTQLYDEYHQDVEMMLHSNIYMMKQLDSLVANYSKGMTLKKSRGQNTDYFNSENFIDLGVVLESRQLIQRDIKNLREEKIASSEFLRIIDKGGVSNYSGRNIFTNPMILYPILLVSGYFILLLLFIAVNKARKLD